MMYGYLFFFFEKSWYISKENLTFACTHLTVAVWPENSFSPLLTRPQGPQGCQMKRNHSLNMPLEVWCAKIDPKLNKLEKTIKIEKNSSKMSVF